MSRRTFQESVKALTVFLALGATAQAGPFAPAKLYAPMFDKGHRWTFDVTTTVRLYDGAHMTVSKDTSVLTCEVAEVKTYASAVASKITCDRQLDSDYAFNPDGLWVAGAAGLARLGEVDLPEAIDDRTPVLAAAPRAATKRTKTEYGGVLVSKVFARGKAWCTSSDTTHYGAGDGALETLCFRPGAGLAWGELDYRGGDPRDVVYVAR